MRDHLGRRGTEGVGDQGDLGVSQCHLDLRCRGGFGPTQQLEGVRIGIVGGHPVIGENLLGEIEMLLGHHGAQHLGEFSTREIGVHALILVRDHDVDAIGMVADVVVDPGAFDLELFGCEPDRAQHPEPAGTADGNDHVAAVGEREDRELDTQLVA